jgi:glycosyltransferase involved in cell wall biosynthesis
VLEGEDIICFSHTPWRGPWKASQQIMSRLAGTNRVLYVGPPGSLRQALHRPRSGEPALPEFERVMAHLTVYHERPWGARVAAARVWSGLFNRLTSGIRLARVRRFAGRQGMAAPILWAFDPSAALGLRAFRRKLLVYHVLDNYLDFFAPGAEKLRASVMRSEAQLLREADVVFTVSEPLLQRYTRTHPHVALVPNGVDYEGFQRTIADAATPVDMMAISKPIIGYVGVMQPDLDFSLLQHLADTRPGWSLVFVGPDELGASREELDRLCRRPNVHYLGPKAVKEVPFYMYACDVCMLPDRTRGFGVLEGDSLKLYEYLASGRPVVATDIPSARRLAPWVRIARDPGEFTRCIEESFGEPVSLAQRRRAAAREHSWSRRVEQLSAVVHQRLLSNGGTAHPKVEATGAPA